MISVFDLFSIGIGPSSSHTVGPMRAAKLFVDSLSAESIEQLHFITVEVFGSLAFTGKGHGTNKAILLGLEGHCPENIDPNMIDSRVLEIYDSKKLHIKQTKVITFNPDLHLIYHYEEQQKFHTNAMRYKAFDQNSQLIAEDLIYSVGGGFIVRDDETSSPSEAGDVTSPYPFTSMKELAELCKKQKRSIAEIMLANESALHGEENVKQRLLDIFRIMRDSIKKGCEATGILPGGLNVKRRANEMQKIFSKKSKPISYEHMDCMNWLNLYAIAVNEENAAGGRVVTAPTNGAAGIIPAVLNYYYEFYPNVTEDKIIEFLLTAGAITILFKTNASISGAEVGCQGEVGVASSMAAAALTAVLGGSVGQVENAAEIAIEHHLGLTCDPIAGLVQIPCIERNAMGAVKAVNAMQLAMAGDGKSYLISLDKAILTMKRTGEGMSHIYKETSLGGLAATYTEC